MKEYTAENERINVLESEVEILRARLEQQQEFTTPDLILAHAVYYLFVVHMCFVSRKGKLQMIWETPGDKAAYDLLAERLNVDFHCLHMRQPCARCTEFYEYMKKHNPRHLEGL